MVFRKIDTFNKNDLKKLKKNKIGKKTLFSSSSSPMSTTENKETRPTHVISFAYFVHLLYFTVFDWFAWLSQILVRMRYVSLKFNNATDCVWSECVAEINKISIQFNTVDNVCTKNKKEKLNFDLVHTSTRSGAVLIVREMEQDRAIKSVASVCFKIR